MRLGRWVGWLVKNTHVPPAPGENQVAVQQSRVFLRLGAASRLGVLEWQKFKGAILSPCEGARTRVPVACVCERFPLALSVRNGPHSPLSLAGL